MSVNYQLTTTTPLLLKQRYAHKEEVWGPPGREWTFKYKSALCLFSHKIEGIVLSNEMSTNEFIQYLIYPTESGKKEEKENVMEQNTAVELVSLDEVGAIAISDADRAYKPVVAEGVAQSVEDFGAEGIQEDADQEVVTAVTVH